MSNPLAAAIATLFLAAGGLLGAAFTFGLGTGQCIPPSVPATYPPHTQPGPPVADWRPPQHRWETPR